MYILFNARCAPHMHAHSHIIMAMRVVYYGAQNSVVDIMWSVEVAEAQGFFALFYCFITELNNN